MSRLRLLLLLATILPASVAAHADTITTDHVVLTFTTPGTPGIVVLPGEPPSGGIPAVTQQYNFSFLDGLTVTDIGSQDYGFGVTTYSGAQPVGTPLSGYFDLNLLLGGTTFTVTSNSGQSTFYGNDPSPLKSITHPNFLAASLFFQPGTYTLSTGSTSTLSYTLNQTTTGAAAPVSVTPEPSSLALLSTGLLGIAGIGLRRVHGAA